MTIRRTTTSNIIKFKALIPEVNEQSRPISFFKAVVLIYQSETYNELIKATQSIDRSSTYIDPTDFGQLQTMIVNQRNRISKTHIII
jgi:hypothetical protein